MMLRLFFLILTVAAAQVAAQAVFAHVIVGNTGAYTLQHWKSDIGLAASKGIDGFVLNIAPPVEGFVGTQVALAFEAANSLAHGWGSHHGGWGGSGGFKLFFSFDYLGSGTPWETGEIVSLLRRYVHNGAYFHYNGRPMVSTFEGPSNSDVSQWSSIRSQIPGGIYFVPDWSSQGPGWEMDLYDGAFSWDMWPNGPHNVSAAPDREWQASLKPAKKSFMMGVSAWFYTDLPGWNKAWVWRGDNAWGRRWRQVLHVLPDFVEIVSWNDYGESHYVGPIFQPGIPQSEGKDARPYVNGRPHTAWLETLPYQIAAYKHAYDPSNPAPRVQAGQEKIVYWYRTAPASAGTTQATGNACLSSINTSPQDTTCYPVDEILEDGIWVLALLAEPGWVEVAIGDGAPRRFEGLGAGLNHFSRTFHGETGNVTVRSSSGVVGEGVAILDAPPDGVANFNAWVGCAGHCS